MDAIVPFWLIVILASIGIAYVGVFTWLIVEINRYCKMTEKFFSDQRYR